jgi:hypothetical protein
LVKLKKWSTGLGWTIRFLEASNVLKKNEICKTMNVGINFLRRLSLCQKSGQLLGLITSCV